MAVELAPHGIRVNAVAPGFVATELAMREAKSDAPWNDGDKRIPLGRIGQPNEIARAIAMLLSADSEFVTGATLTIDGGVTLLTPEECSPCTCFASPTFTRNPNRWAWATREPRPIARPRSRKPAMGG